MSVSETRSGLNILSTMEPPNFGQSNFTSVGRAAFCFEFSVDRDRTDY